MRVLVTGSQGFIGKNLVVRLGEQQGFVVQRFDRGDEPSSLDGLLARADAVVHLAGVNRPRDAAEFSVGNAELTSVLCAAMERSGRSIPLIYTSSCQAEGDTPYARSKRAAEVAIENMVGKTGGPAVIYRLPNVFGKWCRPDYNSVVATFCHNLANDQPIEVHDPAAPLTLAYIDDVVDEFIEALRAPEPGLRWGQVAPQYSLTVGELASQIEAFRNCRTSLQLERVGSGLTRALYATFISDLPILPPVAGEPGSAGHICGNAQDTGFGAIFLLYGPRRGHPWRSLSPYQDREVPGAQGKGELQVPEHPDAGVP
jgi:UDP-2-acetamido-2,6-beta-L-arabino-hexul-4-ose reductase